MFRRLLALPLLLATPLLMGREKAENWIRVTSPHFVVATNTGEKQGRRIADQFERMRSVFHAAFPKLEVDPSAPIIVLAVRQEKDFRALEPEDYLVKGSLKLGGVFVQSPEKNYVLMRLDAEGEHPYAVIYHEYTHLLNSKSAEWMPLWMNEGLAEFYENTEIHGKDASLGEPSAENLHWLRENPLLPLATLFAVDQKSPYYHEERKGSIFYAESWALTHLLEMNDLLQKTHRLSDYSNLLIQRVDPVTAATHSFGDLKKLQSDLEVYIRQAAFRFVEVTTLTEVDDSAFKVEPLTVTQSKALRADFLACNHRTTDAQILLDRVLQEDAKNVSAHETKGFLAFQQGQTDEAKKWYEQAVRLDSQSYRAHYYFAALSINESGDGSQSEQIEKSLRAATRLNPKFPPAFDALAIVLAKRQENLDEAHRMELTAISLDPSKIAYRINLARILMKMEEGQNAIDVLRTTAGMAKTPEESQMASDALTHAQEYADAQAQFAERRVQEEKSQRVGEVIALKVKNRPGFVSKGPHHFVVGVLKRVTCDYPELDLTIAGSATLLPLHVDNYFKIPYTALGFQPAGSLNPCTDLEDRPAKVEYVESADPSVTAQLLSVELHK